MVLVLIHLHRGLLHSEAAVGCPGRVHPESAHLGRGFCLVSIPNDGGHYRGEYFAGYGDHDPALHPGEQTFSQRIGECRKTCEKSRFLAKKQLTLPVMYDNLIERPRCPGVAFKKETWLKNRMNEGSSGIFAVKDLKYYGRKS